MARYMSSVCGDLNIVQKSVHMECVLKQQSEPFQTVRMKRTVFRYLE